MLLLARLASPLKGHRASKCEVINFQIETLYERHDYEQQISCLQRLTQEFRTAWSRNEYALVHSILIRAVSHLSKSTTQLGSAGDSL